MKLYPAYSKGRPTFKQTQPTAGAYLIFHNGSVQYVGSSRTNVVKTAYRHFQRWNDPTQYRATFPKTARIAFFFTTSPKRAAQMERNLIEKYLPSKNTNFPDIPVTTWLPDQSEPAPF